MMMMMRRRRRRRRRKVTMTTGSYANASDDDWLGVALNPRFVG